MLTLKIVALGVLYIFSGGVLYPERYRSNKLIVTTTALVALVGTWYLGKDIYEDLVLDVSEVASQNIQINQSAIPIYKNERTYIDDDESFDDLNEFLSENTDKIVRLKLFLDIDYLNPEITNNEFAHQDDRLDRQVRYGFCPKPNPDFFPCEAWIIYNSEIHTEYVSNEFDGYVDMSGYYYVGSRQAPKTDINITTEISFSKRVLRAVSFAEGFGS